MTKLCLGYKDECDCDKCIHFRLGIQQEKERTKEIIKIFKKKLNEFYFIDKRVQENFKGEWAWLDRQIEDKQ
jgi:hypothetical protein